MSGLTALTFLMRANLPQSARIFSRKDGEDIQPVFIVSAAPCFCCHDNDQVPLPQCARGLRGASKEINPRAKQESKWLAQLQYHMASSARRTALLCSWPSESIARLRDRTLPLFLQKTAEASQSGQPCPHIH